MQTAVAAVQLVTDAPGTAPLDPAASSATWTTSPPLLLLLAVFCCCCLPKMCHAYPAAVVRWPTRLLNPDLDSNSLHKTSSSSNSQSSTTPHSILPQHLAAHRLRHRHKNARRMHFTKEALAYLYKFGYLADAHFTKEQLSDSLKAFQRLAGIAETGKLNQATVKKMRVPRCGNADFRDKQAFMRVKRFTHMSKWTDKVDDDDVLKLSWAVNTYTDDIPHDKIKEIVTGAFNIWQQQTEIPSARNVRLRFEEAAAGQPADISIAWATGSHGDEYAFDGSGSDDTNVLAHTFYPNYQPSGTLNGDIHFDDDERWLAEDTTGTKQGVHFPYVLVHEIGHALGLGHSSHQQAVMNPLYKRQSLDAVRLDLDDQCAVSWNYVGPSNTCLWVWMLVELLPHAQGTDIFDKINSLKQPADATGLNPDQFVYSKSLRQPEMEGLLNSSTLEQILNAHIPVCKDASDSADPVQQMLVSQMQKKLSFSAEDAKLHGPAVCKFLRGLSDMTERKQGRKKTKRHSWPMRGQSAHSWPNSHSRHRSMLRTDSSLKSILEQESFDQLFFEQLFDLVDGAHRRRRAINSI